MATRRKRVKPGDVLELKAGDRFAYLQYIGRHPDYGDTVLVKPRFQQRQAVTAATFSDAYVAFYPVRAAVAQDLVDPIAHLPPPNLPLRLRRAGARSGRRVDTWIITDGSRELVKAKLSEEELRLPIVAIWNHERLIQRIAEGWNPTQEGRDALTNDVEAIPETATTSGGDSRHTIEHYLYVPTRKAASEIAKVLRQQGFRTEDRRGADGVNWLVLARHEAVPTKELMASIRTSMEILIAKVGGEYDGWEADVRRRDGHTPHLH